MARILALPILPVACLVWFLVPAQASPHRAEKVTFHLNQLDVQARVGSIEVYFNPKELTIDKSVPWEKHKNVEGDAPTLEFTSGEPQTMRFELLFDTYEEGSTPDEIIGNFERLVGQAVPITWSRKLWVGTLKSIKRGTPKPGEPRILTLDTHWTDLKPVDPSPRHPFSVDIPGAPEAKTMIREVSIDPQDLPLSPIGRPRRARFTIASPNGLNPELVRWSQTGDRRTIPVTIFDEAKSPVRMYGVEVEGPVMYVIDDPKAVVPYATLEAQIAGGTLQPNDENPLPPPPPGPARGDWKDPLPFFGFAVTIEDPQARTETAFFKSVGGLKTETEVQDYEEGGIAASTRKVIGVTKWPNLILVGPPKPWGRLFTEWVNLAGQGKPEPRTVTIVPLYLLDGKPYAHHRALVLTDVVPDRYEFPSLSGIWSDGELVEKIHLPPSLGVVK